uniref:Trehalose 6-phosphate phosphatase n=2 Tax=Ceratitis capitata TaxID=7213 RepID=W8BDN0_CERCA
MCITVRLLRILPLVLLISRSPARTTASNSIVKRSYIASSSNFAATSASCNSKIKMPEKRTAPAISSLEDFERKLPGYLNENTTLALLLDYDGTLAAIADSPKNTYMTVAMEKLLNQLAIHPKIFLAMISGRALNDVQSRVGIPGITYAGNHGLEIESGNGTRHDYPLPAKLQQHYAPMVVELVENVQKNGAWVEDKTVSLTYHYRDVPADLSGALKQQAIRIIESHGYLANQAHDAIEAKPPVNWHKGEAALLILKDKFGPNWADEIKVIFAGDDNTDEDAMRSLQGVSKSFRVSADPEIQTYADFRLTSQNVVEDLLRWIRKTYKD